MAASAAALRALRRLRAVPPAPVLSPSSPKLPAGAGVGGHLGAPRASLSPTMAAPLLRGYRSQGHAAAGGLLGAHRASLSPSTAPSLLCRFRSEGHAAAAVFGDEPVATRCQFRVTAAGLLGVSCMDLVSPRTAPFLLCHYSSKGPGAADDKPLVHQFILERLENLEQSIKNDMQQFWNDHERIRIELDEFNKEMRRDLQDLERAVDILRKIEKIFLAVMLGTALILVFGHH